MRRREVLLRGAALAAASLAACGGGGDDLPTDAQALDGRGDRDPSVVPPPSNPKARVIVIGCGMAGATVAKYLRLWGDAVDVTLVDRDSRYTSCILSSLVLTGQRSLSSLVFTHDALRSRYGVRTVYEEVRDVDPVSARVTLASGTVLQADRIVMAPGIAFDDVPGLTDPNAMPHAWKAGPQTTLLARQLAGMPKNGSIVLTVPKAPYRCPPGPYERACLLADWMRLRKPQAKLIVLDANPGFVAEADNFGRAFRELYGSVIEYRTDVLIDSVDPASRTLFTNGGAVRGDVVNLIPAQRAPAVVQAAGLANATGGRFAEVGVLDYASTVAPSVHVIGDSSATTQPKAGHIANQEAKVCADALARIFAGGSPDPAPVTNSACFSTITMSKAAWLHAVYQYDSAQRAMLAVPQASGASSGWSGDHFEDMGIWFRALMADSFA
ncbi:MAG: FAD-dependent oxidoreductase [Burkholderiales bacterium]|nr:FAD-dependent oxidoreductase [Burkholderiales bacterium]